jgi:hypothetical protein
MKRKKRLFKGIESLKEQIKIHKDKKEVAEQEGLSDLVNYYEKEIQAKEETLNKKRDILDKQ